MKTEQKAQCKKIWDFQKKYLTDEYNKTFKIHPELDVTLTYYMTPSYSQIELDIGDHSFKASAALKKVFTTLGVDLDDYDNYDEYLSKERDVLQLKYRELLKPLNASNADLQELNRICECEDTFEVWWESVVVDNTSPKSATLRLNASYSAVVSRGVKNVQVGCQSIPISVIRELVALYDTVNAPAQVVATPAKSKTVKK